MDNLKNSQQVKPFTTDRRKQSGKNSAEVSQSHSEQHDTLTAEICKSGQLPTGKRESGLEITGSPADTILLEKLADLEHQQWIDWSRELLEKENISEERELRWRKLWVTYASLTEEEKERDRVWAKKVLFLISEAFKDKKERIIREIYWKFRSAIHSGEHCQIKIEDSKITSFKPLEDTSCYVCDSIHKLEEQIADVFGEEYYLSEKLEEKKDV